MSIEVVLASASPRRKELLTQLGLPFRSQVSHVDESFLQDGPTEKTVQALARRKAEAVAQQIQESALVIGADTVVVLDDQILGKPKDRTHAVQMLRQLQGRSHEVYSGIALIWVQEGNIQQIHTGYKKTDVWMRSLTLEQIEWYVSTGEPLDKAGAYGIQGLGACFIDRIEGCYFNVVGMSLSLLTQMVEKMGFSLFEGFENNI